MTHICFQQFILFLSFYSRYSNSTKRWLEENSLDLVIQRKYKKIHHKFRFSTFSFQKVINRVFLELTIFWQILTELIFWQNRFPFHSLALDEKLFLPPMKLPEGNVFSHVYLSFLPFEVPWDHYP